MTMHSMVIGFVPLLDCAPLIVAADKGYAAAENLQLELVRETSWANIRDRVLVGHFDAAHMLGPMSIASTLGIAHLKVPMIAPMALGLGGNAITVSRALAAALRDQGAAIGADPAVQGSALRQVVQARARNGDAPLTLAMVYPFSAHHYELRYWLAACGIDPDEDVQLVVIPPPYMADALRVGQIDGFCAGEPWNSRAVADGVGSIVTATTAIWRGCPEKVLGMRADWAHQHREETAALVRAVYRAAVWCDQPESRDELANLLAQPRFIGESATLIARGLTGRLVFAASTPPRDEPGFLSFAAGDATLPWRGHALWFYSQMVRWKQLTASDKAAAAALATYRPDIYRRALEPLGLDLPTSDLPAAGTAFFDGVPFAASDIAGYLRSLHATP